MTINDWKKKHVSETASARYEANNDKYKAKHSTNQSSNQKQSGGMNPLSVAQSIADEHNRNENVREIGLANSITREHDDAENVRTVRMPDALSMLRTTSNLANRVRDYQNAANISAEHDMQEDVRGAALRMLAEKVSREHDWNEDAKTPESRRMRASAYADELTRGIQAGTMGEEERKRLAYQMRREATSGNLIENHFNNTDAFSEEELNQLSRLFNLATRGRVENAMAGIGSGIAANLSALPSAVAQDASDWKEYLEQYDGDYWKDFFTQPMSEVRQNQVDAGFTGRPLDESSFARKTYGISQEQKNAATAGLSENGIGGTKYFSPKWLAEQGISVVENAPNMLLTAMNPAVGTAYMVGNAGGNRALELSERGVNAGEAVQRGLVSGAIEALTEKYSIENFLDAFTNNKGALLNILSQMGVEASEESASYVLNYAADLAARDPNAEFSVAELIDNALGGAFSGGIYGGIGQVGRSVGRAASRSEQTQNQTAQQSAAPTAITQAAPAPVESTIDRALREQEERGGISNSTAEAILADSDAMAALGVRTDSSMTKSHQRTAVKEAVRSRQSAQENANAGASGLDVEALGTNSRKNYDYASRRDGGRTADFDAQWKYYNEMGESGVSYDSIPDRPSASPVSTAVKQAAYFAGKNDGMEKAKSLVGRVTAGEHLTDAEIDLLLGHKESRQLFEQAAGVKFSGKMSENQTVVRDYMQNQEWKNAKTIHGDPYGLIESDISKQMNTEDVEFIDTLLKATASRGILSTAESSFANAEVANGFVKVYANAQDAGDAYRGTVKHEVTHRIKELGGKTYRRYERVALALAAQSNGVTEAKLIRTYQNLYATKAGQNLTAAQAREEIAADFAMHFDMDEKSVQAFLNQSAENRRTANTILETIRSALRAIKERFTMDKLTREQMKFTRDLEKAERLWAEALGEASVIAQKTEAAEGGKKTGGKRHSLSSIANTFFGNENMSAAEFEKLNYKETQGYKDYVEICVNNMRQTRPDFDEKAARAEIEAGIDGIIRVAIAAKKAGYDIHDDAAHRDTKDSKNRLLFSSLEPNSEYFTSHDISTICDKRKNFAEIYDDIVRAEEAKGVPQGKRFFDNVDNYFYLHKLMADKGLTQPCRQCYVESMRKNLAPMASAFLRLVNETNPYNLSNDQLYQQNGKNKGAIKTNNATLRERVLALLDEYEMTANDLTTEMLTTADGLAQLKITAPLLYEAFNSFYGQSKPKMPKGATPFRFGELTALLTDEHGRIKRSLVDKISSTGGFRLQSYSDFQLQNFTDVLQVIFEAGTLGLDGHAYTKVPAFLEATKGTNLKRNISIFMYKDGGEWKLDKNDSFPYDLDEIYDIVRADKSGNTGIIAVSQNEDMSAWIMANDMIGYGIPFHKSGLKMGTVRDTIVRDGVREIKGYSGTKDHTKQQTEVWAKAGDDHKAMTKVKKPINIYRFWDFDNKANLSKNELIRKNVEAYIDACNDMGYLPKFREYVMNNDRVLSNTLRYAKELGCVSPNATIDDISFEYGRYRIPYGYYKFLGDFGMFTPDGKASPHEVLSLKNYDFDQAVEFFRDSETLRRNEILQQFANGEERQRYRDSDMTAEELQEVVARKRREIAEDVVNKKNDQTDGNKYSLTDSDGKRLTREQAEYFKDSKIRDENGNLMVVYHGTNQADFTEFLWEKTQRADGGFYGRGHYFTASKGMAERYGDRVMRGYLNITNPFVWSEEVNSYGGRNLTNILARSFAARINMARIFPELFSGKTMEYGEINNRTGEMEEKSIKWRDLEKEIKKTTDTLKPLIFYDGSVQWAYPGEFWDSNVGERYESMEAAEKHKFESAVEAFVETHVGISRNLTFDDQTTWTQDYGSEISDALIGMGYDGAMQNRDGEEIVAFRSNQFKNSNNLKPTDDPDIRRSIKATADLVEKYGRLPQGEYPSREIKFPQQTNDDTRVRRFSRTAAESNALTDDQAGALEQAVLDGVFDYEVVGDKGSIAQAELRVSLDEQQALQDWKTAIGSGNRITKDDITLGEVLLRKAAADGDTDAVVQLTAEIAEAGTRAGQVVQAMRLLKKMSGAGQLASIDVLTKQYQRMLNKRYGNKAPQITIPDSMKQRLAGAKTEEEINAAKDEIFRNIASQIPPTWGDKWNAWRYLSMLGNARTHIRNVAGNALFEPVVCAKNAVGKVLEAGADMVSKKTRGKGIERTKTLLPATKAAKDFAKADYAEMEDIVKNGGKYNDSQKIDDYRTIFTNKALEWARKANGGALEKEDGIFLGWHYRNALASYLTANHVDVSTLNDGSRKSARTLDRARAYAIREAQKATYRDASQTAEIINRASRQSNRAVRMVIEGVLPFKKTPLNILKRGVEYSPAGLVRALYRGVQGVMDGKYSANEVIDDLAAGLTGTGLVAVGYLMTSLNMLSGGADDDDKSRWYKDMLGYQTYALTIGDKSYTLDWAAPGSMPLFVGSELFNLSHGDQLDVGDLLGAVEMLTAPLNNMSMLSGLNDTLDNLAYGGDTDNALYNLFTDSVLSYLSQAVPTIGGQIARTIDGTRRTTYVDETNQLPDSVERSLQKARGKIPLLSKKNPAYINLWGETEETEDPLYRLVSNMVSPGYADTVEMDDLDRELLRLYDATGENVLPNSAGRSIRVDGETKKFTVDEFQTYATTLGQTSHEILYDLVDSMMYQNADDADKVVAVDLAYKYANAVAKTKVSDYQPDGWIADALEGASVGLTPDEAILYEAAVSGIRRDRKKWAEAHEDENPKTSLKEDIIAALDDMDWLSNKERSFLYLSEGYSPKNNPYK